MVLAHSSLAGPRPEIAQPMVQAIGGGDSGQPARVQIDVGVVGEVPLAGVFLYYRWAPHAAFKRVAMREAGDRRFVGLSSELEDGEGLDFYIEARAPEDLDVTMFHPEAAEARPAHTLKSDAGRQTRQMAHEAHQGPPCKREHGRWW